MQEERGWESSEEEEDVTAIGLLQLERSADSADEPDESENDEVLVSEGEDQEEVEESAFEKLIIGALEQLRYV